MSEIFRERFIGCEVSSPPFEKLAELYGAVGYRAETNAQLVEAVSSAIEADKPAVVENAVDPAALDGFRRDSLQHRSN